MSASTMQARRVGSGSAEQRTASRWSEIEIFFDGVEAAVRRSVRSREDRVLPDETLERFASGELLVAANEAKGSAFWTALDEAASADPSFANWLGEAPAFEDLGDAQARAPRIVLPVLRDGEPIYRRSTFRGHPVKLRSLRFPGAPIGAASSREDDHDRAWLEVTIYAVDDGGTAAPRWAVHRAGQTERGLAHSSFAVVDDGDGALKFLADKQTGWVAATALDALDLAVARDPAFADRMGDLLDETNFRAVTGGNRITDTRDRRVLEAMAGGAVLVALGDPPRKIVWQARASNVDRPRPSAFLALSRRGFVRKIAAGDGFSEWTISDRGRTALQEHR